jgi:hypothetical protein
MAWFRFVTNKDDKVKNFCDSVRVKLFKPDVLQSPFTGGVILKEKDDKYEGFVKINPTYPRLEYFWFLLSVIVLFWTSFQTSVMFYVFMFLGLLFGLFRVGAFYFLCFWIGLRKKGYKGKFLPVFKRKLKGDE